VVADLESGKKTIPQVIEEGKRLAQGVSGGHDSVK